VGYELYCQLLENAVRQLKSLPQKENTHVNIDLPVSAYLPSSYIPPGRHKMDVYRKISAITTLRELSELAEELRDRFGPLPEEAIHFLSLKELELLAYHWRIDNIRLEEERFAVFSYTDAQKIHSLAGRPKIDLRIVDQRNAYLLLPKANMRGPSLVEHLKSVLR
jgi:transcription-repair coupling factor (superfamily II helicase)